MAAMMTAKMIPLTGNLCTNRVHYFEAFFANLCMNERPVSKTNSSINLARW